MIGERRHRIMIEQPVETRGTSGQELIEWEYVADVWAKVTYNNSGNKEGLIGEQIMAQITVTFDIAYRNGLNPKMRITFESDLYDIVTIQYPDFRKTTRIIAQKQE